MQSSDAEHLAYRKLSDQDKDRIMPIFEITQFKTGVQISDAKLQIKSSVEDRAFILDISHMPAPGIYIPKVDPDMDKINGQQVKQDEYNTNLSSLLDPQNGFQSWRSLCSEFENSVPVIQFRDALKQSNSILRQASLLSNKHDKLAIRITHNTDENIFRVIGQIIAVIDKVSDLLIILDAGQGRLKKEGRVDFAKNAIAKIKSEVEPSQSADLEFVFLHDSYTTPSAKPLVKYANYAWELWDEVNSEFSVSFGDYTAHKRISKKNTYVPGEWKATVVYPLDEMWLVYRDANNQDADGWIRGARSVCEQEEFEGVPECWGGKILQNAFDGDLAATSSAKYWHAAKINMHIHRQIKYSFQRLIDSL